MLRQRAARRIGFRARDEPERDPALFELVSPAAVCSRSEAPEGVMHT